MKYSNIIIIGIFWSILLPYSLSGYILDESGSPVSDANILVNDSYTSMSEVTGYFQVESSEFIYKVEVSHIAYDLFIDNSLESDFINIILVPKLIDSDRIVVTGTRSERHIKSSPILTHVIGKNDIKLTSYSNVKDILEMTMPNVQMVSSNHGNDRVKIQGLDNKYLTFLVDGDRISGEYAGNLDFSMLGLSNVDKIEVIEGAISTLYGSGSMGGVVNIITKVNNSPYWVNAGVQYDNPVALSPWINVGFNLWRLNYTLNLQYADSDGYDLSPDGNEVFNMTLNENKSNTSDHRFIVKLSDRHKLKISYKEYFSKINRYKYITGSLFFDAPLNKYEDDLLKVKYSYDISDNQMFIASYLSEKYSKYYYYPYYYSNGQYIVNPEDFVNGVLDREEINLYYNINNLDYKRLIGLELYDEDYSSYNIYYPDSSILQESIFDGQDKTENSNNISLYFYEERSIGSNVLSGGLRWLSNEDIILPSLSYMLEGPNNYNFRFSYSSGYRSPSIKEKYYKWEDHAGPDIIGNQDLRPTKNNYFSISLDKRSSINDFSVDLYRNDISDMISTEYDENGDLVYKNFDNVLISGINAHYYRKITDNLKLRFVYNLTDASSSSNEILEGISKHALRLNAYYKLLNEFDLVINAKYIGKKFIFDQEQDFVGNQSLISLPEYFLYDAYIVGSFNHFGIKVGVKNIFDYKDSNRFSSDILNNYDPGRRLFFELSLNFQGELIE